jgi:hypothetical protein
VAMELLGSVAYLQWHEFPRSRHIAVAYFIFVVIVNKHAQ